MESTNMDQCGPGSNDSEDVTPHYSLQFSVIPRTFLFG